ncbi:MAG: hypothetical protein ACXVXC_03680 [Nocardioidaceae bacterium]
MSSNDPFSPRRARADAVAALPGIGMFVGALVGGFFGWFFSLDPTTSVVIGGAGIGIVAGLVVGLVVRGVVQRR